MAKWTVDDIPDQRGKVVVITGANSGLGLEAARALAHKGAHVVMACRSPERAKAAAEDIRRDAPEASLRLMPLDLGSLASVRRFADDTLSRTPRIDVLMNNAGLMAIPHQKTEDGFEMQMGVNHFGHFALTGLLWDALEAAPGARIVNVSSQAHMMGKLRFEDLSWERGYSKWRAYGMSKLANLLFTYELQRRLDKKGKSMLAVAAHPGYAATNLQNVGPELAGATVMAKLTRWGNPLLGQAAAMGALPQLYAAVAPEVQGGDYYGPDGAFGARGYPRRVSSSKASHDALTAQRLWDVSEELTLVRFAKL